MDKANSDKPVRERQKLQDFTHLWSLKKIKPISQTQKSDLGTCILSCSVPRGGVKMAEEQDGEITFSSTNSSKEQQNGEQSLQNNF